MLKELIILATALNGLLAGASLDQSIKQVPSRHRIGIGTYAAYVRGADMGSGVVWYAVLSNTAALTAMAAAIVAWREPVAGQLAFAVLQLCGFLSIGHSLATLIAAPTMFKTKKVPLDDARRLTLLFNRFACWQAARATLQVLTFLFLLWSLALDLAR